MNVVIDLKTSVVEKIEILYLKENICKITMKQRKVVVFI